jgi:hypothetical protein
MRRKAIPDRLMDRRGDVVCAASTHYRSTQCLDLEAAPHLKVPRHGRLPLRREARRLLEDPIHRVRAQLDTLSPGDGLHFGTGGGQQSLPFGAGQEGSDARACQGGDAFDVGDEEELLDEGLSLRRRRLRRLCTEGRPLGRPQ